MTAPARAPLFLFVTLLLLVETSGSSSGKTGTHNGKSLSQTTVGAGALTLSRARVAADLFNQASHGRTGQSSASHVLAALRHAAFTMFSILLRTTPASDTRTGASARPAFALSGLRLATQCSHTGSYSGSTNS